MHYVSIVRLFEQLMLSLSILRVDSFFLQIITILRNRSLFGGVKERNKKRTQPPFVIHNPNCMIELVVTADELDANTNNYPADLCNRLLILAAASAICREHAKEFQGLIDSITSEGGSGEPSFLTKTQSDFVKSLLLKSAQDLMLLFDEGSFHTLYCSTWLDSLITNYVHCWVF